MYLMYVDESGDPGALPDSPTDSFILSGVVVHESMWYQIYDKLFAFRRSMFRQFGLEMGEEIHSTHWFGNMRSKKGKKVGIKNPNVRLAIYRLFLEEIASLPNIKIINVIVDKIGKPYDYDIFFNAWRALFQRFENTLNRRNFPGGFDQDESGIVVCDQTNGDMLRKIILDLRIRNIIRPGSNRGGGRLDLPISRIIDEPFMRNSAHSYFAQMADVCVYSLKQFCHPSALMKRKKGNNYFNLLSRILCKEASYRNYTGVARI